MQGFACHLKEFGIYRQCTGMPSRVLKVLTSKFHFKYITVAAVFKKVFSMLTVEVDKLEAKNRRD